MDKIHSIIKTLGEMGYDAMFNPYGQYLQVALRTDSDYLTVFSIGIEQIKDEEYTIKHIVKELNNRIKEDL